MTTYIRYVLIGTVSAILVALGTWVYGLKLQVDSIPVYKETIKILKEEKNKLSTNLTQCTKNKSTLEKSLKEQNKILDKFKTDLSLEQERNEINNINNQKKIDLLRSQVYTYKPTDNDCEDTNYFLKDQMETLYENINNF